MWKSYFEKIVEDCAPERFEHLHTELTKLGGSSLRADEFKDLARKAASSVLVAASANLPEKLPSPTPWLL